MRGIGRYEEHGFTLVELLVSLFIFGMLSAAGVALLSFSVRAQEAADARLGDLADFRRAGALLAGDLAQAAPRLARDETGRARPAFQGYGGEQGGVVLAFVRRGWENLDDAPRASLQRVEYSLVEDRLERRVYPRLDGASPLPAATMVDGVRRIRLRYRDREGAWRERWDPTKATELPRAVELVMDARGSGATRELFQTGPME
ncbi:MAG: ral secretion pathway protein [Sphingomonadales bacterium]|jgi:general secretion pathway protein J|nr:ral secretion pathway protein [Sphingomonadales bacterium]